MEKEKKCCSCEADFEKEIDELVDGVDGYTKEDREKKEEEVRDAFSGKDDAKK